jgi:hypothetical protein
MVFIGAAVGCLIATAVLIFQGEMAKALASLVFACMFVGVVALIGKDSAGMERQDNLSH